MGERSMVIGSSMRVTLPERVSFGIKRDRADVFWLSAFSKCVLFTTSCGFFCLAMEMASPMESASAETCVANPKSKQIVTVRFIASDKIKNALTKSPLFCLKWRISPIKGILTDLNGIGEDFGEYVWERFRNALKLLFVFKRRE